MTYDVTDHPALSAAARRLDSTDLEAHADIAEALLELVGTALDPTRGALAVALQVNHQVQLGPEGFAYQSSGRGARSWTTRSGDPSVSPLARRIVDGMTGWPIAGGIR